MTNTKKIASVLTLLLATLLFLISGCDSSDNSDKTTDSSDTRQQVIVFAAASTTNSINDIAKAFTEETAIDVVTNFASSSALAQQIESGADADVFISANQKWADYLEEKQFSAQKKTILANRIVIVVPSDSDITGDSADILSSSEIKNISMGDPSAVPAGKYGKQALEKLGLWNDISAKVTAAKDVRSALAYVETRAAEAGIVYSTDAAISDKVKVVYLFPEDAADTPISYPAMISSKAVNKDAAQKFYDYLSNDKAKKIFAGYGFITE